jgi:8-oxo-dGTP diphosphatase
MRQGAFYAAVFGIIRDPTGKILMVKRQNSGFRDGFYALPAGHVEIGESPMQAMIRELQEEVSITVTPADIRIIHICHSFSPQETTPEVRQYFSFYYEVLSYTGTLTNAEPEKSESISWIDWKAEEKIQFREILEKIEN